MTDSPSLPDGPAARLLAYLERNGCAARLVAPGVPMPTVAEAARAIGVAPELILKSLLFVTSSGAAVLAIAAGSGKVSRSRLTAASGLTTLTLADADTVRGVTGYPVGGVAPVGHAERVPVVIDQRVMGLTVAYGGGGAEDLLLEISPLEIQRLTGATVADIADPASKVARVDPVGP